MTAEYYMEYLQNNLTLHIPPECFPLSTDSIALSEFVRLPKNARVLDLGSGCGTLGLLLCARDDTCRITGLELDAAAHIAALENISRNGLESRMESRNTDLRAAPVAAYTTCISNPPYFTGGPDATRAPTARRNDYCDLPALFSAAQRSLQFGGDFYLVHKPERLAQLCACAVSSGLEPKRLRLLHHKEGGPVSLVLLACRKGAKPGLVWEEYSLHHADGSPTHYYQKLYHLEEDD